MARLVDWLEGGDLRSDGAANQAAQAVLQNEALVADLAEGLSHEDAVVRGRTLDALEKIARTRPELVHPYLSQVIALMRTCCLEIWRSMKRRSYRCCPCCWGC